METDLAIHPEWKEQTDAIVANQATVDHYVFPDLPFN